MNANIPAFQALCRRSHFTKIEEDEGAFDNVWVFGIQSVGGKILTFHVMTDYGMLRSRVPISEIFFKKPYQDLPTHFKQLWDCFSEDVNVTRFDYMVGKRCEVVLKDSVKVWATYMFTVDWFNNPYSENPSDYKCAHILAADDGYLLAMPNNRIYWKDMNWITKPFPGYQIKVDNELISVESFSDRWVSEDTSSFYYDIQSYENHSKTTSVPTRDNQGERE
jgi:hypothetical protein